MGLDGNTTRFLLYAKRRGVDFSSTATVGRQFFYLDAPALKTVLQDFGYTLSEAQIMGLLLRNEGYTEPLFQLLGACEIRSFDASTYEGASDVHDFNLPIPEELCNRFSAVVDGGSLEHVFNLPVAIRNCMQMVRVGGHFLGMSPANNWFGHGFYQLSPEFFFRVFSRQNGFEMVCALVCELGGEDWFEVLDPAIVQGRAALINARETYLLTLARKVETVSIFSTHPQQGDYVEQWRKTAPQVLRPVPPPAAGQPGLSGKLRKALPAPLKVPVRLWRALRAGNRPQFDSRFFKKVTIP